MKKEHRHPDAVRIAKSFQDDSARRDITINALGLTKDGEIIDYQGGIDDLKNKIIRAVGEPKKRFEEDALRLLRITRFASKFGFTIEPETKKAIEELKPLIQHVSPERLHDELFKIAGIGGPALANFIEKLDETGMLKLYLPEVKKMQGMIHTKETHPEGFMVQKKNTSNNWEQYNPMNPNHNDPTKYEVVKVGDAYDHTLAALKQSQTNDAITNLAILFHDIAKAITQAWTDMGSPSYKKHDIKGVEQFNKIAKRLKFSNKEKDAITFAINHHMVGHNLSKLKKSKILALRQHPYWDVLKRTIYADDSSRGFGLFDPEEFNQRMNRVEQIFKKFGETQEFERKMKDLVNGNMIIKLLPKIKGIDIGKVKKQTREWIIKRDFNVTPEEVNNYIRKLGMML